MISDCKVPLVIILLTTELPISDALVYETRVTVDLWSTSTLAPVND